MKILITVSFVYTALLLGCRSEDKKIESSESAKSSESVTPGDSHYPKKSTTTNEEQLEDEGEYQYVTIGTPTPENVHLLHKAKEEEEEQEDPKPE